ncbi:MAG: NGG1p interacting factor NIF3 [Gammaproteobacteria bacterium]|nr:MAG: NGG1p interacting factor NIF3 [Gammaproteobacteria bacterium]
MFKICVYVPEDSVEKVKLALFKAGAGRIGNYGSCCWQTDGIGQFLPLSGSEPTIGNTDKLEHVYEIKIEMVCSDDFIKSAILALKENHPYEEPAYDIWKLEDISKL